VNTAHQTYLAFGVRLVRLNITEVRADLNNMQMEADVIHNQRHL